MANFVYTGHKYRSQKGEIDYDTADVRVILVMSNTTADTDQDATFVGDITTLDEMDGANYGRKAVGTETVTKDDANNRSELSGTIPTWSQLGAGTRQVVGAVFYVHVTNDADSYVIGYVDTGGFPFTANGGDFTITPNAEGILQYA